MKYFILFIFLINCLWAKEPLKIVYNIGTPPLKFTTKNKQATGLLIDIWKLWAQKNKIEIKFIESKWDDSIEMIKNGSADIHAGIYYTKQRDQFLDYTSKSLYTNKKYFFYNNRILEAKSKNDLLPYVIGIDNGYPIKFMKENFPQYSIKSYKSADETSAAIIKGEVKVILSSLPSFMYYLNNNYIDKELFKFSDTTLVYTKDYFGAVKQGNQELLNFIDNGFKKISKEELKNIESKWLSHIQYIKKEWIGVKVKEILSSHTLHKIIIVIGIILLIIIYWNRKLQNEIDQRKKIEDELKTQKKQLDMIFSHIPIPILIVSKESKDIIFANEYAAKIYKIKLNQLIGKKTDILYTSTHQKQSILSAIHENCMLTNYETIYKINDGTHIDVLLSLIPINFDGFEANLGVVTDVTYLKKIQLELKEETQKANEASSAKSEFLAKMSHEIRTPMNAVLGMLYLIQKTNLTPIQEGYITKANSAANSLLSIIDDILDFSKIEAGKLSIEQKEFTFNDMLYETIDIMSFKAQSKGCELLAYYDSTIPTIVKSDKIRIGQVLTNLINNAIKFTDNAEVIVSSKLVKQEKNIATIMFCVKDNGIGIEKENVKVLFKDFSQADNTITRKFGGTGLGLAISKKLVELLGGKIWVEETKIGVGSTFCFTIKCEISNKITKINYLFPKEFNNINTLIIDDNLIACDILKSMLESFGFNVDIVYNGEDGYNAIANSDKIYDIVFLDYKMPKLNGIQTYQKIKTIPNKEVPKTILITAYSQNDIIKEISKLGIENYLIKPASPSILYNTVMEVLNPNITENIDILKENTNNELNLKGVKILLAEDNELNQDFAKELLQSVNISVDIASDGLEAVDLIKSKSYDAILMDIQMPNMDGLTATKTIREFQTQDKYFQDIPIIALSANALTSDKEKSLQAGMNEHISKPIIPKELFAALQKFLKDFKPIDVAQKENIKEEIALINHEVINIKEAVDRMGGNQNAYIKLLKQFSVKYKNAFDDITMLLSQSNTKELKNKIHEIKGIAGNLSANKLFDTLDQIEKVLKVKNTPNKDLYDTLKVDFNNIFQEISNLSLQKSDTKVFDKDKVIALLDTIKDNLERDIVLCENSLEELLPYLEKDYMDFSENLASSLNEFDIDSAFNIIEKFLKDLKGE